MLFEKNSDSIDIFHFEPKRFSPWNADAARDTLNLIKKMKKNAAFQRVKLLFQSTFSGTFFVHTTMCKTTVNNLIIFLNWGL